MCSHHFRILTAFGTFRWAAVAAHMVPWPDAGFSQQGQSAAERCQEVHTLRLTLSENQAKFMSRAHLRCHPGVLLVLTSLLSRAVVCMPSAKAVPSKASRPIHFQPHCFSQREDSHIPKSMGHDVRLIASPNTQCQTHNEHTGNS